MTDNEQKYFEARLDEQFNNVHQKLNQVIDLQKIANGRTSKNEEEIQKLKEWRAMSQGSWKATAAIGSIIGAIVGLIAAILFR
jgi:hypothetical protein